AANPFSDVPAGHWAYDSVAKLAAAGVVDGYADGAFDGDKLMTRYEMAQIVAKAMAKGANVDKLAAEFADELDTLGVRVAKLEKGADAVKITGQIRYHYKQNDGDADGHANNLRSRIYFKGQINDDWAYTGLIQNNQNFDNDEGDEEETTFQRAYVTGKLGGLDVTAGRYNMYLVNGNLYDHRADAVEVSYGKDVKLTAFYGKPTDMDGEVNFTAGTNDKVDVEYGETYGAHVATEIGVVKATAGYTVYKDGVADYYQNDTLTKADISLPDNKVWNVGVAFDLAKDLTLTADYLKSDIDSITGQNNDEYKIDDEGIVVGLSLKGAKASAPGSWGLYGNWYDQGRGTVMAHTMNGDYGETGFEGWMVGANYTLAKNIVAAVEYYDLETKGMGDAVAKEDIETLWTQVIFTF
ncbi:MAG: S-layer homology domain-containing protein, partial [Phascolarctobacterium sp.]|nr:S-layer homology domain-containing protein [Phascolarctobacterium sp.]